MTKIPREERDRLPSRGAMKATLRQGGYAAFSVSLSNVDDVIHDIENQEAHHRKMTFQEELRLFLQRHGVEYDERDVWD